jgi:hypothetical protein
MGRRREDGIVSELLPLRPLVLALGSWLPGLLSVVGLGAITFEVAVGHPDAVRFARDGRTVVGQATTVVTHDISRGEAPRTMYSRIFVEDPELGPQTIEVSRALRPGERVPLLCLTPARRCESADIVHERLSLWPLTPLVLSGGGALAGAGLMALARAYLLRRRVTVEPSPEPIE